MQKKVSNTSQLALRERSRVRIRGLLPPATQETLRISALAKFDFVQRLEKAGKSTGEKLVANYGGEFLAPHRWRSEEAFENAYYNLAMANLLLSRHGKEPITRSELRALYFKKGK